ncbi:MAG: proton-conducting transporter membrane subunit [Chloroflexi bacterium]|nr:proton-conducting transporter membrane subunit [Chloroflexota bacterium]
MGDTYASPLPLIAVLLPVAAALLVLVTGERYRNVRDSWSTIAAVIMVGVVALMLPDVLSGRVPQTTIIEISPGIDIMLRADAAGMIFALLASSLWVVASVYAVGYMRAEREHKQTRFFTAFALSIAAAAGVALSANLLTFVLFYELLSLFTYPLIIHRETESAIAAGRKYLAYTLSGGVLLIGGTAWVHMLGIDGSFVAGGLLFGEGISKTTSWGLFALLVTGVSVKAGVMPLHGWLPSAMVAPTPVSALLHAVAVVKAGVFGMVRMLVFVFGAQVLREIDASQVIVAFAAVTLLVGSMLALRHDNLKRRLAYSTISHLSYIVLGVALLGPIALVGALLHIVGHGVTKITLFFVAGAIHAHTHKENVSEMDGIGRQMPITMGAFTLASLSMVGIPPFVLFTSKFYLGWGAAQVDQQIFIIVYLFSGVLAAGYLFPVVVRAFWRSSPDHVRYHEADMRMVVPLAITGVLALFLGIAPDAPFHFFELASDVAAASFGVGEMLAGGGN